MSRTDIDTGTEDCLAYEANGIEVITLNRPEARNALTDPMKDGMGIALDYAARSHSVRSVVVTGAGGAFCAGPSLFGNILMRLRVSLPLESATFPGTDP